MRTKKKPAEPESVQKTTIPLKVKMQLGRWTGGSERGWRLVIDDAASLAQVIEVEFDDATFADLMSSSQSGRTSTAILNRSHVIGRRHEHKEVEIECVMFADIGAIQFEAQRANPGWSPDPEKTFNRHRYRDGKYRVVMRRWVA